MSSIRLGRGRRRHMALEKLYLTFTEAAEYTGIGEKTLRDFAHSDDPPPYIKIGKKVMLQRAKLPDYLERKQEVRM